MRLHMTFCVADIQILNIISKSPSLQFSPEYLKCVQNSNKPETLKSNLSSCQYNHNDLGNSETENLTAVLYYSCRRGPSNKVSMAFEVIWPFNAGLLFLMCTASIMANLLLSRA